MANIPLRIKQAEVTVDVGSLTVDITPPTTVNVVNTNGERDTNFTIPAGKVRVILENKGGESFADITVNGTSVAPGQRYEAVIIYDGVNRYLLPEYVVVTNGSLVSFSYDT
jgi:hypothetical protein